MPAKIPPLDSVVALDCEMVSTSDEAWEYNPIALARVAVTSHTGEVIYDTFVHIAKSLVSDYCTDSSGVTAADLEGAPSFAEVRKKVKEITKGKIIVGHALFNDLAALEIQQPLENTRDTSLFYPLRKRMGIKREGEYPGLRTIAIEILGVDIRPGEPLKGRGKNKDEEKATAAKGKENGKKSKVRQDGKEKEKGMGHDPVIDAKTTMNVYLAYRDEWEEALAAGKDVTSAIPPHYMDWYF